MTKKQKQQRKQERLARIQRDKERYPGAHYAPRNLQIIFTEGEAWGCIRTNDLTQFRPSAIGGDCGWVEASVPLDNINEVSGLARALVARLNALIEDANENIGKTKLRTLKQAK